MAVAAAVAAKPLPLPAAAERSAHRGMDATPCLWSPHSPGSSTSSTIPFRIECLKGSRDVAETLAPDAHYPQHIRADCLTRRPIMRQMRSSGSWMSAWRRARSEWRLAYASTCAAKARTDSRMLASSTSASGRGSGSAAASKSLRRAKFRGHDSTLQSPPPTYIAPQKSQGRGRGMSRRE